MTRVCDALRATDRGSALPAGTVCPARPRSPTHSRSAGRHLGRRPAFSPARGCWTSARRGHVRRRLQARICAMRWTDVVVVREHPRGRPRPGRTRPFHRADCAAFEVAQALESPGSAKVARISRVRLVDGAPLAVAAEYLSLERARFRSSDSPPSPAAPSTNFLIRELGLKLLRSEMSVTAVGATAQQAKDSKSGAALHLLQMREMHFGEGIGACCTPINRHNSAVDRPHARALGHARMTRLLLDRQPFHRRSRVRRRLDAMGGARRQRRLCGAWAWRSGASGRSSSRHSARTIRLAPLQARIELARLPSSAPHPARLGTL